MTQAKSKTAEAKAVDGAKAAEAEKTSTLDMVAINTIGSHKPGDKFKAKDKTAFERFVSLGAAKSASK